MAGKTNLKIRLVIAVFLASAGVANAIEVGEVFYVDDNAPGPVHDGNSWSTAYDSLQDALARVESLPASQKPFIIYVSDSETYPDVNAANPNGSGDREATFRLINGVTIKGGYAGYGAPDPNYRNIKLYKSILSGDINLPGDANDNSYHVVTASGTEPNAVLDGFFITFGNANGSGADANGGGLYNDSGSPTITNCYFWRCSAKSQGGAVWSGWSQAISITHTSASGNSANEGGALCNFAGFLEAKNCTFSDNDANNGGGVATLGGTFTAENCTIYGNYAQNNGGGIFNANTSTATFKNFVVWDNSAPAGPQIYNDGTSSATVTYSDVQGVYPGTGNINADPCFVDPAGQDGLIGTYDDDFHLRSQGGRWDGARFVYSDTQTSPAIDAGCPPDPLGDETFPNGGLRNQGAYGGTSEASRSFFGGEPCRTWISGDINGDCIIDFRDFSFMSQHWLEDNRTY